MLPPEEISNKSLKSILNQIAYIDELAWNDFVQGQEERVFKKRELIWDEGQVCGHLVFLKKGLVRSFNFEHNKEVTFNFYDANSLFYDDYSFISQMPSRKIYQVLEDSTVTLISRTHLLSLFDKHKCFERIGRIAVENAHTAMIEERERLSLNSAEQNYQYFLMNSPHLIQRVSQKIIASYLNISTEHLSRIRAKITKG